jgi:hypothetical protein
MNKDIELLVNKILSNCKNENDIKMFTDYLNNYNEEKKNIIEENALINKIIDHFFEENIFYYNRTSKIYYNQYPDNIILLNEDNIIHYIFDYITNNKIRKIDTNKKTALKNKIIKKIKENSIYDIIPDTELIQYILNYLYPTIFNNRDTAKLFLIILGNILLRRDISNIIIFTKLNIKPLLNEINKYMSIYFCNINIYNNIKFKYNIEHEKKDKLMLNCNDINYSMFKMDERFFINLICVSIYYSNIYNDIYEFINNEFYDNDVKNNLLYLNNNSKKDIIKEFTNKFLEKKYNQSIKEKELIYLWKKFTEDTNMFVNPFFSINDFIETIFKTYDCSYSTNTNNNILYGYYSLDTPYIDNFKKFWNENFYHDENETYFELNEIYFIVNKFNKNINIDNNKIKLILQALMDYEIISNKYIHNINCKLWNKKKEINDFITKNNININLQNTQEIYKLYTKLFNNKNQLKIGKKYFDNYIKQLKS